MPVIAADIDPLCVDRLYQKVREEKKSGIHPLRVNLANPTPALGWANRERPSLLERGGRRDLVLALALVHHLCLGRNISPGEVGGLFRRLGRWIVVEFVPKDDPQSRRLLRTRADIFDRYTENHFLEAMGREGSLEDRCSVGQSGRTLYLMRTHD